MNEYFSQLDTTVTQQLLWTWGTKAILALFVLIIGFWISKSLARLIVRILNKRNWDKILSAFIGHIVHVTLHAAVIIASLDILGFETTSLLAVLGAAGLAIGLALKDSLGNLAAGAMLVGLRPFKEGDYVEVAGTSGTVSSVSLFHTTLTTPDNCKVIVPNGQITASTITNYTAMPTRRIDLIIGIAYSDDLKLAQKVMRDVITSHEGVFGDPEPTILLMELADSSVNFAVRPWVRKEDYWTIRSQLLEQLKAALEEAGCSIPFPQRDIHNYHHKTTVEDSE